MSNGTTLRPANRCRMASWRASTADCVTSASTSTCSPTSRRHARSSKNGGSTTTPTDRTRALTGLHRLSSQHAPHQGITGTDSPYKRGQVGEQVIYTTNHKQGGMFLPAEDRRHFVAWSERKKTDFAAGFWDKMWAWIESGGDSHVAAYLASYDISKFNPKAPPLQTAAFWEIVDSNRAPEQSELADVLDQMDNPQATTLDMLADATNERMDHEFASWLKDRKNRRIIPHRMEKCGYVVVRNDAADDGLWKIAGKRQTVYALAVISAAARHKAATTLQQQGKRR